MWLAQPLACDWRILLLWQGSYSLFECHFSTSLVGRKARQMALVHEGKVIG
jgi:hypothetical protein